VRVESLVLGLVVSVEHGTQGFQHEGDLVGKGVMDLDELAAPMGNTGRGLRGMIPRGVARQGVGHLDRGHGVVAPVEDLGEVLPGMTRSGFEQGDRAIDGLGDDAAGEHPGALGVSSRGQRLGPRLGGEFQDAHGGVVVIEHRALRRLLGQLLHRGGEARRGRRDHIPLGSGRQGDGQRLLQALDAMKRQPAAVFQQGDHGGGGRVVFRRAHARGGVGRKHRAAQPTAQPLQGVDLRLQGRHAGDAHQDGGLLALDIDPAGATGLGTGVALLQGGVGNRDARGAGILVGPVAAVASACLLVGRQRGIAVAGARRRRVGVGRRRRGIARRWLVLAQDRVRGLGAGSENQPTHPLQGGGRGLQFLGQARQGVDRRLEGGVVIHRQRLGTGALDNGIESRDGDRHPRGARVLTPAHAATGRWCRSVVFIHGVIPHRTPPRHAPGVNARHTGAPAAARQSPPASNTASSWGASTCPGGPLGQCRKRPSDRRF